ncbi:sulfotransferase family protein [Candidatus Bipolaricaulota bacterium]|nr:sulfotransferase family protein [Candidatus Bipolaricaulota bacterium]
MSSGLFKANGKRCVFIHIPKNAGNSITKALNVTGLDHLSIKWFPDRLFSCAFVRNPWDRVVSAFFFLNQGGKNPIDWLNGLRYLSQYEGDFTHFVRQGLSGGSPKVFGDRSFRPQYQFICKESKQVSVDFIGKYENLSSDLNSLAERLGFEIENIPHLNPSDHKKYREYYTDRTRQIVADTYKEDIELFDYSF